MRHGLWISGLLAGLLAVGCGGSTTETVKPGAMPQGGTFTGVWFSPQYGEMHMVQTGTSVVGRYEKAERTGRIQGNVSGDLLRFQWTEERELIAGRPTETSGRGYFRVMKDEREDVFKLLGRWGHDENDTNGGEWNAVKSKKQRPSLGDGSTSTADSSGGYGSTDDSTDWQEEESSESYPDDLSDL